MGFVGRRVVNREEHMKQSGNEGYEWLLAVMLNSCTVTIARENRTVTLTRNKTKLAETQGISK